MFESKPRAVEKKESSTETGSSELMHHSTCEHCVHCTQLLYTF